MNTSNPTAARLLCSQASTNLRAARALSAGYLVCSCETRLLLPLTRRCLQESKWLKDKLAENAYVFGEHLDASSRYIASKAPRVTLPTAYSSNSSSAVQTAVCRHVRVRESVLSPSRYSVYFPFGTRQLVRCYFYRHRCILPSALLFACLQDAIDQSLSNGGSYSHQWDKSAGCQWNPVYCKI